jgi:hypothetical protein
MYLQDFHCFVSPESLLIGMRIQKHAQNLKIDGVLFRNRTETGSLGMSYFAEIESGDYSQRWGQIAGIEQKITS